jgi:hypothetical protein
MIYSILWAAASGVYGEVYLSVQPDDPDAGHQRMRSAVFVDIINMLFWFISSAYSFVPVYITST